MKRHLAIGAIVILATALGAGGGALAERAPYAVPLDTRIRTVAFEKDNVVVVYGTIGVSTMIVLGNDERIATVAIGDSLAWQAVPDQSKRYLFIKPLDKTAVTNMNIVTNKRIYNLILRAGATNSRVVFKLRFSYPDEESSARLLSKAQAMAAWPNLKELKKNGNANFDYAYKGHIAAKPDAVFDDGIKTFFRFTGEVPAIFVVNLDKTETLANYRREGQFIVVDKVAGQFTMRNGPNTACVFNLRAVAEPKPKTQMVDVQPETQTQHVPEETGFFARLFVDQSQ
jgi:type IV secretion system protein VirB9